MVFLAASVQLHDVARFTAGHNAKWTSVSLYVVILKQLTVQRSMCHVLRQLR